MTTVKLDNKRKIVKHKVFGGRRYKAYGTAHSKRDAQAVAKTVRMQGSLARIHKTGIASYPYMVYVIWR